MRRKMTGMPEEETPLLVVEVVLQGDGTVSFAPRAKIRGEERQVLSESGGYDPEFYAHVKLLSIQLAQQIDHAELLAQLVDAVYQQMENLMGQFIRMAGGKREN